MQVKAQLIEIRLKRGILKLELIYALFELRTQSINFLHVVQHSTGLRDTTQVFHYVTTAQEVAHSELKKRLKR